MILEWAILFLFPAAMAFAGSMDLFTLTIPNRVILVLAAGFLCLAPFAGFSWNEIALHAATASAMLALGILAFARGWIGGGDAKLFAAVTLWLGPEHLFAFAMIGSVLGGGLTLAILFARRIPLPAGLESQAWIVRLHDSSHGVPYGIALSAAGLIIYPQTAWMQALV